MSSLKAFTMQKGKNRFILLREQTHREEMFFTRSESSSSQSCTKAVATSSSFLFGGSYLAKCVFSSTLCSVLRLSAHCNCSRVRFCSVFK